MKEPAKRRQYPVFSRNRQYRMVFLILFYTCSVCGVLFLCLFVPDIVLMQDESAKIAYRAAAADRILSMHARLWPTVLAIICLIGLHAFRRFTQILGPMYRFQAAFEGVAAGEMDHRVHLRASDEFKEEAAAFNTMMDGLAAKVAQCQESMGAVAAAANLLATTAATEAPGHKQTLAEFETQIEVLNTAVAALAAPAPPDDGHGDR